MTRPPAATSALVGLPALIGYVPALTGLRGIAVVGVLGCHGFFSLCNGAWTGVEIFFVLSGYLISSILLTEWRQDGSISLRRFYARRVLRLWPALFALLLMVGVLSLTAYRRVPESNRVFNQVLVTLFYVANWSRAAGNHMGPLGHTWSLAIEEQFYLLWPPFLALMLWRGLSLRAILGWTAVVATGSFLYRGLASGLVSGTRMYYGSDTRAASLLLGCFVAVLVAYARPPQRALPVLNITGHVAAALLVLGTFIPNTSTVLTLDGGLSLTGLLAGAVILTLIWTDRSLLHAIFDRTPLVQLGEISYGLYLWHYPIFLAPLPMGSWKGSWVDTTVRFLLTLMVSVGSYRIIEKPFLKLKGRFRRLAPPAHGEAPTEASNDKAITTAPT